MEIDKKLYLLDIDGTLLIGDRLIEGADIFIDFLKANNKKFILVSNNVTKSIDDYIHIFAKNGVRLIPDNFLTARQYCIHYLREKYGDKKIYTLAGDSLSEALYSAGVNITDNPYDDNISCVLISYDDTLNYEKLKNVCYVLTSNKDVDYIATNSDMTCPVAFGYVPDCGAICEMIAHCVKREPVYLGKPERYMLEMAIDRYGYDKEDVVMIGDKKETDIVAGNNAGVDTVLIMRDKKRRPCIIRDVLEKPTKIYSSIYELVSL